MKNQSLSKLTNGIMTQTSYQHDLQKSQQSRDCQMQNCGTNGKTSLTTGHTNALIQKAARSIGLQLGETASSQELAGVIEPQVLEVAKEARALLPQELGSQLAGMIPNLWGQISTQKATPLSSEDYEVAMQYKSFLNWLLTPASKKHGKHLVIDCMRLLVEDPFLRSDETYRQLKADNLAAALECYPYWAVKKAVKFFIEDFKGVPEIVEIKSRCEKIVWQYKMDRMNINEILALGVR